MPATGWAGVAGSAAAVRRRTSKQSPETGRRSAAAAGWVGSRDVEVAAGSGCVRGAVGDGGVVVAAAVAAGGGAAASVGAAAGVGAGSSVMR